MKKIYLLFALSIASFSWGFSQLDFDDACSTAFEDISTSGTANTVTDDSEFNFILPFAFSLDGVASSDLRVGANGGILFDATAGNVGTGNPTLPGFYPFNDDLDIQTNDTIFTEVLGTAPNRRAIIQFEDKCHNNFTTGGITFQVVLFETTNEITFVYTDLIFGSATYDNAVSADITVIGANGEYEYSSNTDVTGLACLNYSIPSCPQPNTLDAANITDVSADLSWISANPSVYTEIEYVAGGGAQGSGVLEMGVGASPYNLMGLTAATAYDWYVRTTCGAGDTSTWAGPFRFLTELPVLTCATGTPFPIFESSFETNPACGTGTSEWNSYLGFENTNTLTGTFSGAMWRIECATASPSGWIDAGPFDGTAYAYMESSDAGVGSDPIADTLTSPTWDATTLSGGAIFSFYYLNGGASTLEVERSTDGGTTWTNVLTDAGLGGTASPDNGVWTPFSDDFSALLGTIPSITYRFIGTASGTNSGDIGLDLMKLESCLSCVPVSSPSIVAVTDDVAEIYWTVNGTETNWVVEYGLAGFTPGTGTVIPSANDTLAISGLMETSTYDFYVKADCGGGDTSAVTGPLSVTTGIFAVVCAPGTGNPFSIFASSFETNPACGTGTSEWNSYLGFENTNTLTGTFSGAMWRIECATTSPSGWIDAGPFDGTAYAYMESSDAGVGTDPIADTLTSLTWDVSALTGGAKFSFYYLNGGSTNLEVERSTDGGTTWTNVLTDAGLGGTAAPDNGVWTPFADDISALIGTIPSVTYRFIGTATGSNSGDLGLDLVKLEACVSCLPPSALATSVIAPDSGLVTFTPYGAGDSSVIEYGTSGFVLGTGTIIATANDSVYLSGLMAETTYDVYVYSSCATSTGDSSSTISSSFTTPCGITNVFPSVEDFDALTPNNAGVFACITTDNVTNCWSNEAANTNMWTARSSATGSGSTGPSADHTGGGNYLFLETSSCFSNTSFLYSTEYDVSSLSNPRLKFWYHMWGADMGTLSVEISTDQGATWSPSVWTLSGDQGNSWIEAEVDLVAYANAPSLVLRFTGLSGTDFTSDMGIDDVQIDQLPTCLEPTAFVSSNVSTDSIDLAWTSNGVGTEYEVAFGASGFAPGAVANVTGIMDTFTTVSGLMPLTAYDIYVRANCGPADSSVWTGPISFTTLATCLEPLALGASPVFADSANLFWTANGVATEWEVELGAAGFAATGVPTDLGIMDTFYLASGLTPETSYDYYVRSRCSAVDSSVWSGPFTFTTTCAAITPFYTTGFATTQPNCWDLANDGNPTTGATGIGTTNEWTTRTTYNPAGSAVINLFTTGASDWLLSPTFDLTAGIHQVTVEVAITNFASAAADADGMTGTDDEVQLVYSIDGGITWINITTWNASNQPPVTGSIETFVLPSLGAGVQFAIWGSEGAIDDVPDYDFHVNSFTVELAPANDVGVSALTAPTGGCGSEFTPIVVEVTNFGINDQTFIPVVVELTGAITGTYTAVVNSLLAGASTTVTLDSVDTEIGGLVDFTAFTVFPIDEDFTNDTTFTSIEFGTVPVAPVFMGETICEGDSFTRSSSTNVKVYEAGSTVVLANDTSFSLSPMTTTTYEYEAIGSVTENVGATTAPTGGFTTTPDWGVRFNTSTGFVLNSLVLYPSGSGTVDISIIDDATETVLQTVAGIAVTDGGSAFSAITVPLGFVIPASVSDYRIVMSAFTGIASLGRGSGLGGFPYTTSGGEVSILGGATGGSNGTSTSYYWFYDWNVSIEGCPSDRESFTIEVAPATLDTVVTSACDSMMIAGNMETMSGFYSDTMMSMNGCDSITVFDLTINNSTTGVMTAGFCTGDSVALPDGSFASVAGTFDVTIPNAVGCDSVITVTVSENLATASTLAASFCSGDSVALPDGSFASVAGTVTVTIANVAGCDSVITVTVTESLPTTSNQTASFCSGSSFTLADGTVVTTGGTYTSTLVNAAGCDSVITTNLTEVNSFNVSQNVQLCAGDSVVVGTNVYSSTGTYMDTLTSAAGCDSMVTTNLVVFTAIDVTLGGASSICDNVSPITLSLDPVGGTLSGTGVTGSTFDPAVAGVGPHLLTYTFTDANGCNAMASLDVEVVVCTGIEDLEGIETLSIYPNPFVNTINVQFEDAKSSDLTVTLFDVLGKEILVKTISSNIGMNNIAIEVPSEVATGVHMLQLERDGSIYNTTLIKE